MTETMLEDYSAALKVFSDTADKQKSVSTDSKIS